MSNVSKNSLHEGRAKPLRGFTPRERLDAADPLLRVIGATTEQIELGDANADPARAGDEYSLGGFVAGIFRVTHSDNGNYAEYQTYRDGSGDAAVKIMTALVGPGGSSAGDDVNRRDSDFSATDPATPGAQDAIVFTVREVDGRDELILINDLDEDGDGTGQSEAVLAIQRLG